MLYFIRNARRKAIKVGYSHDVAKRLCGLQSSNPDKLMLLGICPGGRSEEAELHVRLAHMHLRGEWFKECPELLEIAAVLCAGHRLYGRCHRCRTPNRPLHEALDGFVCDDCGPPGLPATLRRSRYAQERSDRIPTGGGYRIMRGKRKA